jgi:hypothetical protein
MKFSFNTNNLFLLIIFLLLIGLNLHSQSSLDFKRSKGKHVGNIHKINWTGVQTFRDFNGDEKSYISFDGAVYDQNQNLLPVYSYSEKAQQNVKDVNATLSEQSWEPLSQEEQAVIEQNELKIPSSLELNSYISVSRKINFAKLAFVPLRRNPTSNRLEKLTSFKLEFDFQKGQTTRKSASRSYKVSSVLRSGNWYKIGITENGVHKVSYNMMANMGIDVVGLPTNSIRLFGNGGGMLPMLNSEPRLDDLTENNIQIVDVNNNGQFDQADYFMFYGQSQNQWTYNNGTYRHETNIYADTTYYFITTDYQIGQPKRVSNQSQISGSADVVVNQFDDHQLHEINQRNLIKSGRRWFGEQFSVKRNYTIPFTMPNIITSEPVTIRAAVASRAIGRSSSFTFSYNSNPVLGISFSNGVVAGYANQFARYGDNENTFTASSPNVSINVRYNNANSVDNGWLDYIELIGKRRLELGSDQLVFRNSESDTSNIVDYQLSGELNGVEIWDVTNPIEPEKPSISNGQNQISFKSASNKLEEFVAFNQNNLLTPSYSGKVKNQNLHGLSAADYLIVSHPKFLSEAERLADFHRDYSNLSVHVVTTNQIYIEYSSGAQDLTAIRDFVKMFYDRAGLNEEEMPQYLLLFGDASYDYKSRVSGNTNFVPAYQSLNSMRPTASFISDDYFGFLDDGESDELVSSLDIGIGRLPVSSNAQARGVVNKIIRYHNTPTTFDSWRNSVTFIGDDEDRNIHMRQANNLARKIDTNYPDYNVNKILFDAYKQVATAGGQSYPDVNEEINNAMKRGTLFMCYVGHGGETGWAHERVLNVNDVNNWTNRDYMPLFLTATCEFSRYDDPERTSAGEFVLLNPDGGGIGLMTTTRLVYSSPNYELSQTFTDYAFEAVDGEVPTLGELLMLSKDVSFINNSNGVNYRNFALLGDPAIRLAYPQYNVMTTNAPDTIKALEKVTVDGMIADEYGAKVDDFNGTVQVTVYDQPQEVSTLDNDDEGVFKYNSQESIIFKGKSTVKNGEFSFIFVVPKDIIFDFGKSKISYYADDGTIDANGAYEKMVIGGRSENAGSDQKGPEVNLWMNDESFVVGGMTDQNPNLFAKVFDENGINTVGNGIGHDITAILDENTANAIVLNDYYESDLDSYQSGTITYPFDKLEEGKHTLSLKVWDVYNNSGKAFTEFIVADNSELAIDHILNYPNPFTTNTAFYFDHNAPGQELDVRIQVFTVSGKLVKTLDAIFASNSYRAGPIYWDGRDEFGDEIGKGVYIYKVKVTAPTGKTVNKFEKLVLLN